MIPHPKKTQVGVPWTDEQTLPHAWQLAMVFSSVSHPSDRSLSLQSPKPDAQAPPSHEPPTQTGLMWFVEQGVSHAPQWSGRIARLATLVVPVLVCWPLIAGIEGTATTGAFGALNERL